MFNTLNDRWVQYILDHHYHGGKQNKGGNSSCPRAAKALKPVAWGLGKDGNALNRAIWVQQNIAVITMRATQKHKQTKKHNHHRHHHHHPKIGIENTPISNMVGLKLCKWL
jgi:hypothetical protein